MSIGISVQALCPLGHFDHVLFLIDTLSP
jgi:hypothetical protein